MNHLRGEVRIIRWWWAVLLLLRWSTTLCTVVLRHGDEVIASTSTDNKTVPKVVEKLWESMKQRMKNEQRRRKENNNEKVAAEKQQQQQQSTLSAPHVYTRGGPNVATRRRLLYEHGLHHHYTQLLRLNNEQQMSTDDDDETRRVVQNVYDHYVYQPDGIRDAKARAADRSSSLHAALPPLPKSKREANRLLIRQMFTHAYDSYMIHGWPEPEVRPVSCQPGTFDLIKIKGLTLIDTLDTLIVMGNYTEFARSVERLRQQHLLEHLFDVDENVSLFETTIRVLGGLLSAHQMSVAYLTPPLKNMTKKSRLKSKDDGETLGAYVLDSDVFTATGTVRWGYDMPTPQTEASTCSAYLKESTRWMVTELCEDTTFDRPDACLAEPTPTARNKTASQRPTFWVYDGFLLELARDIGERLIPAFDNTRTGIPYGTVNLQSGVPKNETTVASLAGGGTLTLEFELLSRLTGDEKFGKAAKLASRALWMRRSTHNNLNLFGKHIDIQKGHWTETLSGIGSNSDSFFEYLAKHYVLYPEDDDFWTMLAAAYSGVHEHSRLGEWYVDTEMSAGAQSGRSRHVLESLMAFYPGMQVLLGEIAPAARSLNSFFIVRELLGFLPERFNFGVWHLDSGRGHASHHPLRPELLESCYFLHRGTQGLAARKNDTATDLTSGWLWAADFALHKLETVTRTECGYSAVHDVNPQTTGTVDGFTKVDDIQFIDEMPSFFLSETLKYLYLTFDDGNILHRDNERQWIFTTEAHPIHNVPAVHTKPFKEDMESLKTVLRDLLDKKQPMKDGSHDNLCYEKWTDQTNSGSFRQDIANFRAFTVVSRERMHGDGQSDFFVSSQVTDSFVSPDNEDIHMGAKQEQNTAFNAMKNNGVGSGWQLRKSCPNVYSSDNLWMHAINGGATDYADVYISVMSDDVADHPNAFVGLGAAEALGILGTGLYPGEVDEGETCPVTDEFDSEHAQVKAQEEESADGIAVPTDSPPKKVALDARDFQVSTFSSGDGFVVEHVKTNDKVIVTFVNDEQDKEKLFTLVYAGYSLDEMSTETSSRAQTPSSHWRMARGHRKAATHSADIGHTPVSFARKVIMADLEGYSFSCEIELLRRAGEGEEVLLTLPCAPALFGRTRIDDLRETGGFIVEAIIMAPPEGSEMGCVNEVDTDDQSGWNETTSFSDSAGSVFKSSTDDSTGPGGVFSEVRPSIQVVYRGDCTFHSKAVNMKDRWGAEAVIVVNTEDDELFVMSHGEPYQETASTDSTELPYTVLVTGLDGEDLLSIVNGGAADSGYITARISMRRQLISVEDKKVAIAIDGDSHPWPGVIGSPNSLQILAKGGWGVMGVQKDKQEGWDLNLLQYE